MKWIVSILLIILLTLQYRIWFGDAAFKKIKSQELKVVQIKKENIEFTSRNKRLLAEINDLRNGTNAIEERARFQLGMIKEGEIFFRILKKD